VQRTPYAQTEYIKEELTQLDRIPTNGGFYHFESELSRSIGQDGEISDIKRNNQHKPTHSNIGFLEPEDYGETLLFGGGTVNNFNYQEPFVPETHRSMNI
jgi:hypothetical protein